MLHMPSLVILSIAPIELVLAQPSDEGGRWQDKEIENSYMEDIVCRVSE